jgi:hypothetical protein
VSFHNDPWLEESPWEQDAPDRWERADQREREDEAAQDRLTRDAGERRSFVVLGRCPHGVDLDRAFCSKGCRV